MNVFAVHYLCICCYVLILCLFNKGYQPIFTRKPRGIFSEQYTGNMTSMSPSTYQIGNAGSYGASSTVHQYLYGMHCVYYLCISYAMY